MNITVPDFVDYPEFYNVKDNLKIFNGVFVYIIEPYKLDGQALYIGFRNEHSIVRLSDFKSDNISKSDLDDMSNNILYWSEYLKKIMLSARIPDALFYFSSSGCKLVDVMISANKFLGPGMLNDLFGNVVPIQDVITHVVLDDDNIKKYNNKFIKPSRFRYLTENGIIRPQYGIIQ